MPLYSYKCDKCGEITEAFRKIADLDNGPDCCKVKTHKVMDAPAIKSTFLGGAKNEGYVSPLSGKFIDSERKRKNEMKEFNVVAKE